MKCKKCGQELLDHGLPPCENQPEMPPVKSPKPSKDLRELYYVITRDESPIAVYLGALDGAQQALEGVRREEWIEDMSLEGCYREGVSLERYTKENHFELRGPIRGRWRN